MLKVILILVLTFSQITTYGRSEETISAPEQTNISQTLNSNIDKPHKSQKLLDILKTKEGTSGKTNEDITKNTQANIKHFISGSHSNDVLSNQNNKSFQNDTRELPDSNKKNNNGNNSDQDSSGETNGNIKKDTQVNIKQLSLDNHEKDVLLNQKNKGFQNSNQKSNSSNNSDAEEEKIHDHELQNLNPGNVTASDNYNETTLNSETKINKNVKNENLEHETAKSVNISRIKGSGNEEVQDTYKSIENGNETMEEVKHKQGGLSSNDPENKYLAKKLNITTSNNHISTRLLNINADMDKKLYEKVGYRNTKDKTSDSVYVTKKGNSVNDNTHIQHIAKSMGTNSKTHIQHIARSKGTDDNTHTNVARRQQGRVKGKPKPKAHRKRKPPSRSHKKPPNKNRNQSKPKLKPTNPPKSNKKTSNEWKADAVNVTTVSKLNNSQNEGKGMGKSERQDKAELSSSNNNKASKPVKIEKSSNNENDRFQNKVNIQNKYLQFYEQYMNENHPLVKRPVSTASHNKKQINLTYNLKKGTGLRISLTFDVLKSNSGYIHSSRNKSNYTNNSKFKQILHKHGNLKKGVNGTNDALKIRVKVKVTLMRNRPAFNFTYYNSIASTHSNSSSNATILTNYDDANNTIMEVTSFNLNTVKRKPKVPSFNLNTVKRRPKLKTRRKPKEFINYETYIQEYRSLRGKRELKYTNIYNHPQTLEQSRTNSKIPNTHKRSSGVAIPLHNLQKLSLIPRDYGNKGISDIGHTPPSQKFLDHKLRSGWKALMNYKFGKPGFVYCNRCGYRNKLQSSNPASFNLKKLHLMPKNLKYLYISRMFNTYPW